MHSIKAIRHSLKLPVVICSPVHCLAARPAWILDQAWIELHQDELDAVWQLAVNGFRPGKIAPLK